MEYKETRFISEQMLPDTEKQKYFMNGLFFDLNPTKGKSFDHLKMLWSDLKNSTEEFLSEEETYTVDSVRFIIEPRPEDVLAYHHLYFETSDIKQRWINNIWVPFKLRN